MKLLVTGGLGFIGKKLVERLRNDGHEVTILDNYRTNISEAIEQIEIVKVDITDFSNLYNSLRLKKFDCILHLAAQSSGKASFDDPETDLRINILGILNIIQLAKRISIERIIFASSFTVYGDNKEFQQLAEDTPCNPLSLYALGKLTGEHYLKIYAEHIGIKWNALRMFNVYGPGQDMKRPDQGLVSIFMNFAYKGNVIEMKGSPSRFRDLIYIDDVIDAWVRCLDSNHHNEIFNVGSGIKTEFSELINELGLVFNKKLTIEVVGETPGDVLGCYADVEKARDLIGFVPKVKLADGLRRFKEWADKN